MGHGHEAVRGQLSTSDVRDKYIDRDAEGGQGHVRDKLSTDYETIHRHQMEPRASNTV